MKTESCARMIYDMRTSVRVIDSFQNNNCLSTPTKPQLNSAENKILSMGYSIMNRNASNVGTDGINSYGNRNTDLDQDSNQDFDQDSDQDLDENMDQDLNQDFDQDFDKDLDQDFDEDLNQDQVSGLRNSFIDSQKNQSELKREIISQHGEDFYKTDVVDSRRQSVSRPSIRKHEDNTLEAANRHRISVKRHDVPAPWNGKYQNNNITSVFLNIRVGESSDSIWPEKTKAEIGEAQTFNNVSNNASNQKPSKSIRATYMPIKLTDRKERRPTSYQQPLNSLQRQCANSVQGKPLLSSTLTGQKYSLGNYQGDIRKQKVATTATTNTIATTAAAATTTTTAATTAVAATTAAASAVAAVSAAAVANKNCGNTAGCVQAEELIENCLEELNELLIAYKILRKYGCHRTGTRNVKVNNKNDDGNDDCCKNVVDADASTVASAGGTSSDNYDNADSSNIHGSAIDNEPTHSSRCNTSVGRFIDDRSICLQTEQQRPDCDRIRQSKTIHANDLQQVIRAVSDLQNMLDSNMLNMKTTSANAQSKNVCSDKAKNKCIGQAESKRSFKRNNNNNNSVQKSDDDDDHVHRRRRHHHAHRQHRHNHHHHHHQHHHRRCSSKNKYATQTKVPSSMATVVSDGETSSGGTTHLERVRQRKLQIKEENNRRIMEEVAKSYEDNRERLCNSVKTSSFNSSQVAKSVFGHAGTERFGAVRQKGYSMKTSKHVITDRSSTSSINKSSSKSTTKANDDKPNKVEPINGVQENTTEVDIAMEDDKQSTTGNRKLVLSADALKSLLITTNSQPAFTKTNQTSTVQPAHHSRKVLGIGDTGICHDDAHLWRNRQRNPITGLFDYMDAVEKKAVTKLEPNEINKESASLLQLQNKISRLYAFMDTISHRVSALEHKHIQRSTLNCNPTATMNERTPDVQLANEGTADRYDGHTGIMDIEHKVTELYRKYKEEGNLFL